MPIAIRLYKLMITMLSLILIFGCGVLELENHRTRNLHETSEETGGKVKNKILQFHDILYFMIVTLGTEGYGDIVP